MLKPVDILMAGVGGQGTILASKILARAALETGYDIKVSEIHGMAQRGGSVVTQVRLGEKVFSPLISTGGADLVLAFEKLEGLRLMPFLRADGVMIINKQEIPPVPVLVGAAEYPAGIVEYIRKAGRRVVDVDAPAVAEKCGNVKAANVVLLGVMAGRLPFNREVWEPALAACVPARLLDVNRAAFAAGYEYK